MDPSIRDLKKTTFHGRRLTRREIAGIQKTVGMFPALSRRELALTVCEHLNWRTPSGGDRLAACLRTLEHLELEGVLTLPSKRDTASGPPRPIRHTAASDPQPEIACRLSDLEPLSLAAADGRAERSEWNELVDRHHPLGCPRPFGPSLRWFILDRDGAAARLPAVRGGGPGAAGAGRMDRLGRAPARAVAAPGAWELAVPDPPVGAGGEPGLAGPGDGGGAPAGGVEGTPRLPTGAGGDLRRPHAPRRRLLPRGQLDPRRRDRRPQVGEAPEAGEGDLRQAPRRGGSATRSGGVRGLRPHRRRRRPRRTGRPRRTATTRWSGRWLRIIDAATALADAHDGLWRRRRRVLGTLLVMLFVFRLVLSRGQKGYATVLAELWEQCRRRGVALPQARPVAASSICKARARVDEGLFPRPAPRDPAARRRRRALARAPAAGGGRQQDAPPAPAGRRRVQAPRQRPLPPGAGLLPVPARLQGAGRLLPRPPTPASGPPRCATSNTCRRAT